MDQTVLDAAGLGGRPAYTRDAAGAGTALLVDVSGGEMLTAWARARDAVGETGRWPVLCPRLSVRDGSVFDRFYFEEGSNGGGSDPAAVLARAETVDVDARLAELARAPEEEDAEEEPEDAGIQDWYGSTDQPMTLVLLPVAQPWAVYAYIHTLDAASWYGQDLLVAAARRWYDRYGAEPVATLDVATWFTVARPPSDPDEARRLALEHHTLAEDTLVTPNVSLRQHAHQVARLNHWVLFAGP